MQIRFGPDHDVRHIDTKEPGGYEWWYFDAISDDGQWVLVAIYFLGTPMSPYYKAVVDGKMPLPSDWCGVFFSLHEKVNGRWTERAYTYNIYRGGEFSDTETSVAIGGSSLRSEPIAIGTRWNLSVNERALWRGNVEAQISFESKRNLRLPDLPDDFNDFHAWVCVAPQCRVEGTIKTSNGASIAFSGSGYHDHNFGTLPFGDVDVWYWGRAFVRGGDGATGLAIYYDVEHIDGSHQALCLLLDYRGDLASQDQTARSLSESVRNAYGFEYRSQLELGTNAVAKPAERRLEMTIGMKHQSGLFSEGPFYRRLPIAITLRELQAPMSEAREWEAFGNGIGEVFRPSRLCGPIASRAMWSRMRRR